ncbi:methenyltetrahydromethanopterin cyclohydrolase [Moorella naiadis]|uniref:methenyltetrahydromethanopterin cyclohydrolase n=1 Tax=Moorella naiadis (nom. illeg.) TaxID=3093670 RepID=UPI003D9C7F6D
MPGDLRISLNNIAAQILAAEVLPQAESLGIGVTRLANGATVVDMGIEYPGSWTAAKYFVEIGLGGLGQLAFSTYRLDGFLTPAVRITVTYPLIAEMASHVAYWKLNHQGKNVVISGPIRSIRAPDIFARATAYRDLYATKAVACIQTTEIPGEGLAELIAGEIDILPDSIYILAAKTASIVGAVQVCARNVEQTLPTLYDRGFDIAKIVQAEGLTPVVSIVDDEEVAYGHVNDCLIYGQESNIYVRCRDEELTRILTDIPFVKNSDIYGTSFQELFQRCQNDWALVPRDWDAPCQVNLINLATGSIFSTGTPHLGILTSDFLGVKE